MNAALRIGLWVSAILVGSPASADSTALSAAPLPGPAAPGPMEEVSILGDPTRVAAIPGSAHALDSEFLARFEQSDIMRVLRSVPGIYLQEEDGAGLRPNIGIRGSGLDRSSRIALLEDGVLISPAPYAAPSAYYFPTQRRMSSVEVLKGPASVRLGPRTTGGAMNMISTPVPDQRVLRAELLAGQDGFADAHAWYGDGNSRAAWLLETVQQRSDGFKQLDNGGDTGYDTRDYLGKLRLHSAPDSEFYHVAELKVGYTRHVSNETYLGLTEQDFASNPNQRYAASQLDQMRNAHHQQQLSYFAEPNDGAWHLEVTAYNNEFQRNWFKLESVNGARIASILMDPESYTDEMAWIRGEADSPDNALKLRNNNRSYYSRGVQSSLEWANQWGGNEHNWRASLRVHRDEVDRFQHDDHFAMRDGQVTLTEAGTPGTQSNRVSDANVIALSIEDRIDFGRLELTPGLRYEQIDLVRRDYAGTDATRSAGPITERRNSLDVLIPGFGASYSTDNGWVWLGGVHKGFNPPSPGSSANEEKSTNYELGVRYSGAQLQAEAIGFLNQYQNLVGTCTASTGGACDIGDQFDGGKARISGVEMLWDYQMPIAQSARFTVPVRLVYTWTAQARFDTSFDSSFGPWGDVRAGDDLPYVPEHQVQLAVDLQASRWSAGLNLNYVGKTRAMAGQGVIPESDLIDAHLVADLSGRFRLNDNFELFARIDNLLDESYAVARRPAGLRPGKPRTVLAGFSVEL